MENELDWRITINDNAMHDEYEKCDKSTQEAVYS